MSKAIDKQCIMRVFFVTMPLLFVMTGCSLGPKRIRSDWRHYNESVVNVANEEMLLNLVRMRYNDAPGFLPVASVTAQRSWSYSGSLSGVIPEGGPRSLSAGGTALATERPTVAFLPGGKDVVDATLSPLTLDTLFLLSYTGWPTSKSWPLMVKSINGIQNAPKAGTPMHGGPEDFSEFVELGLNLYRLQERNLIEVGRIEKLVPLNTQVRAGSLTAAENREAAEAGFVYRQAENSDDLILSKRRQIPVLRFARNAIGTAEHKAIVAILHLDPDTNAYEFESALEGFLNEMDEKNKTIKIGLRSIVEIMYLLSKGVQVPECHLTNGLAQTNNLGIDWFELLGGFQIHCSDKRPKCASIAVQHRDCWFYIDDRDQNSKTTFLLLRLIFDAQVQGGGAENLPVLTLPL